MNIYRAKPSEDTKMFLFMVIGIPLLIICIGLWREQLEAYIPALFIFPAFMTPIAYLFYRHQRCVALTNKTIQIVRTHNSKVELEFLLSDIELLAFEKVPLQGYRMGIKLGREMDVHDLRGVDTPQATRLIKDLEIQGIQVIISD